MMNRTTARKTTAAINKNTAPRKRTVGSMVGLSLVFLLTMAGMYLWSSRRALKPVAVQAKDAEATFTPQHIYSETANPSDEIAAALAQAKREHKRVLLDFGGDWCPDCQALNYYFHQAPNAELLAKNYVLVDVWIGHMDANLDVAKRYGVPISRGVPALSVLTAEGTVVHAQQAGEFNDMRNMQSASVTEFLQEWKS